MKSYQKERLLNTIQQIRDTYFVDPAMIEESESQILILQGRFEKLKVYVLRIEDEFIKEQVAKIISDFDPDDYRFAVIQFNKIIPILDEIEDYLFMEDYQSISTFKERIELQKQPYENANPDIDEAKLDSITKEIAKGNTMKALDYIISIRKENGLPLDDVLLLQSQISVIKKQYEKGVITFDDFITRNSRIVVSVITESNKLRKPNTN